ncbi:MAG: hypothetical protein H5T69_03270 [Chloroflexi bacterium]|nr:hypothetical protein [Chloroflexota bacterium]
MWDAWTFDSTATQGRKGWDFFALYQAGHNLLTGVSIYESADHLLDVIVPQRTPYRYLPFPACTLGLALQIIPPLWAYGIWLLVLEGILLRCTITAWRLGGAKRGVYLASLWLLFSPYYLELYMGQFSLPQAALILLILLAETNSAKGILSRSLDVGWAASLLWKQNTGLYTPLFLRHRRWRTLLIGIGSVFITSMPYFIRDPDGLVRFAANLISEPPSHQLGNLGMRQLIFSLSTALIPDTRWPGHQTLQNLWVAIILALCLYATWRNNAQSLVESLCLWTTCFFLLYHHVWEHHYVMLLPVYTLLIARHSSPLLWALFGLTALWTPYRLLDLWGLAAIDASMRWRPIQPHLLDIAYHASKAVPTLVLWGYLLRIVWRRSGAKT